MHCPPFYTGVKKLRKKSGNENVVATVVSVVEKTGKLLRTQNESNLNFSFLHLLKISLPTKLTTRNFSYVRSRKGRKLKGVRKIWHLVEGR